MKIILVFLIAVFLAGPAWAVEPVRQPGFNKTGNPRTSGNKIMSREEYIARNKARTSGNKSLLSSGDRIVSKDKHGRTIIKNKLNRQFGQGNVNAANTLISNFNE